MIGEGPSFTFLLPIFPSLFRNLFPFVYFSGFFYGGGELFGVPKFALCPHHNPFTHYKKSNRTPYNKQNIQLNQSAAKNNFNSCSTLPFPVEKVGSQEKRFIKFSFVYYLGRPCTVLFTYKPYQSGLTLIMLRVRGILSHATLK